MNDVQWHWSIMLGKEVIKNGIKYSLEQSITINIKWIHIGHQHFVTKRDLQNYICVCVYVYMYICMSVCVCITKWL